MKALLLSAIVFGVLLDAIPGSAETIFHAASGACIHPSGGSTNPSDNTPLIFHYGDCSSGASKLQFRFLSGGAIQHIPSGKCVHPEGGSPNPPENTRLILHNGCDGDRLRFRVTSSGSIQHLTSGKCIHSDGGASRPSNDTQLVLHNGCNEPRLAFQIRSIQAQSPGFQVCNRSSTTLGVAYVTKRMGNFGSNGAGANTITESQGWVSIASGKCRVLYSGDASDVAG